MAVKVRPYRQQAGTFEVDIAFDWPDGSKFRWRRLAPVNTENQAKRWGEAKERELYKRGKPAPVLERPKAPTLAEFAPKYIAHARGEKQKASTIDTKAKVLEQHLLPRLGKLRLDEIGSEHIQNVRADLATLDNKTVNNVLSILGHLYTVAVDYGAIPASARPKMKRLKVATAEAPFHDREDFTKLVEAAASLGARPHLVVLLGGRAGLRRGEILSLKWTDVDLRRKSIQVRTSVWKDIEDTPKSGQVRHVPMTDDLAAALKAHQRLRGPYVICQDDGQRVPPWMVQDWIQAAHKRAGLKGGRSLHILRHSFCSHLAIAGAAVTVIQKLAGHSTLAMTMRYMHLAPSDMTAAVRLLTQEKAPAVGEGVEKHLLRA